MNVRALKSFMKDQLPFTLAYFTGNFLIGLFYSISVGKRIELVYPLLISVFVYLLVLVYQFMEYFRMYRELGEMIRFYDHRGDYHKELNRKVNDTIKAIHKEYLDKLNTLESSRKKERRFLSLWIHNMKTPITVTDLLLQRIGKGEIEAEQGVELLKEENGKLLTNLDMVLNMLRLEEFVKDYVPERIDLMSELTKVINKNRSLFIHNNVFPKIITDIKEVIILSDIKWNDLMISQIISNAVKYSKDEESSKAVYFALEREGDRVVLSIRDEGIGIPEHDISRVCEPFFTGDNGRKGYQSSGIGLYFCSEVCRMLGHDFSIHSKVGEGTVVKISYLSKL